MDMAAFIAGGIGTGLAIRFLSQGIGAAVALLYSILRPV